MSKFLEIVEGNTPDVDLDSLIDAKRTLQRMLIKLGVEVEAKVFKDILLVKLPDGRTVELEVKGVKKATEEEAEDATVIQAIANYTPASKKVKGPLDADMLVAQKKLKTKVSELAKVL